MFSSVLISPGKHRRELIKKKFPLVSISFVIFWQVVKHYLQLIKWFNNAFPSNSYCDKQTPVAHVSIIRLFHYDSFTFTFEIFMHFFSKGNNLWNCVLNSARYDIYYLFMYCVSLHICGTISTSKFLKKVEFIYFMKCFRKSSKYLLEDKTLNLTRTKLISGKTTFRIIKDEIRSRTFDNASFKCTYNLNVIYIK